MNVALYMAAAQGSLAGTGRKTTTHGPWRTIQAGKRQVGFKRKIIECPLSPELRLKGAHAEVSYSIKVYEFKIMIC